MAPFLKITSQGIILSVKVQPRASKDEICETIGDCLKVRVKAPPVESAANEAVVELIASKLGVPRRRVQLIRGKSSRQKQLLILEVPAERIEQALRG